MAQLGSSSIFIPTVWGRKRFHLLPKHAFILLLALGILIRIPLIFESESNGFQYASWRQTDTASIAHNLVYTKLNLFYPQINWRGAGTGYVETEFQLYPFITAVLYKVFGEHIELGLLVSFLFSVGTIGLFYALARRMLEPLAAFFALFFFVISPLFIRYSVVFMPEPTMLFFYMASLLLFHCWLSKPHLRILLLAAVSTALAILVKPTSIHIGLIFFFLLFQQYRWQLFRKWQLWLFALISLLPSLLWYVHARNLYLEYGNTFGILSGGDSKFDNLRYWFSPSFYQSLLWIDLKWVLAGGGIIPFLIGLRLALQQRRLSLIAFGTLSVLLYYLMIPRYTRFAEYYHIFAVPYAALGVGVGFAWIFQYFNNRNQPSQQRAVPQLFLGAISIILILFSTYISYSRAVVTYPQPLNQCAKYVAQLVPERSLIIVSTNSVSNENGTPNNFQEPDIFFYSHRLGWSLPADWHTPAIINEYHRQGGEYFVIYDKALYESNAALKAYLKSSSQQVGPGIETGCGIYRLEN